MTGRPSSFTPDVAAKICELVEAGETIRQITSREGMPASWSTISRWLRERDDFRIQYTHARETSAAVFEERILTEADAATPETAQVARVRVDALKWVMSKRAPKVYGDKLSLDGKVDGTINVVTGVPRAG